MGEAKRSREALKSTILRDLDRYERPMTPDEEALCSAIRTLPVVTAWRAPYDQLMLTRMNPRECHANARFMERNDPVPGRTAHILGWMVTPAIFILHSVIRQGEDLICVTPHLAGDISGASIDFAPDPSLQMVLEPVVEGATEQKFRIERSGVSIMAQKDVRHDLAKVVEFARQVRASIHGGMHPIEAADRAAHALV